MLDTDGIFQVKAECWGSKETGDTDTAGEGQRSQAHVKWRLEGSSVWGEAGAGLLESRHQCSPGHLGDSSCNTAERHMLRPGFLETPEHSLLWDRQPAGTHCREEGPAEGKTVPL